MADHKRGLSLTDEELAACGPSASEFQAVAAERDRYRDALEGIAEDERAEHTCRHSDTAREALDG